MLPAAVGKVVRLSRHEEQILDAVRTGKPHDCGGAAVRADFLRGLCTQPEPAKRVTRRGIELVRAVFAEELDLSFCEVAFPLVFRDCSFDGGINLTAATLCHAEFHGGSCNGVSAANLTVTLDLVLSGVRVKGTLALPEVKVQRSLKLAGTRISSPGGVALNGNHLDVWGDIDMREGFLALGEVSLAGAKVGGSLHCEGATLMAGDAVRDGSGRRRFRGRALNAEGIDVGSDVYLNEGFQSYGEVRLVGARVRDTIEVIGGKFRNRNGKALTADRAQAGGSVFLRDAYVLGETRLYGAVIGSNLDCGRARMTNPGASALSADRVVVSGTVHLTDGFRAVGEVGLVSARITGSIVCIGAWLENRGKTALAAEGAVMGGSFYLDNGSKASERFLAVGEIVLTGASIGRDFIARRAHLHNPEGRRALNGERMQVGGKADLDGVVANHVIVLDGARIQSTLSLAGAYFTEAGGLSAKHLRVAGDLVWSGVRCSPRSLLDLTDARLGQLADDEGSWPEKGNLFLDGCEYESINSGTQDARTRLAWIALQGDRSYLPHPYEQLVKALRRDGQHVDARTVLIAREAARRRAPRSGSRGWLRSVAWGSWLKSCLLGVTIRYGYAVWPAFWLSTGIVIGGAWVFHDAFEKGAMVEVRSHVRWARPAVSSADGAAVHARLAGTVTASTGSPAGAAAAGGVAALAHHAAAVRTSQAYPEFNALAYSLDAFLPLVDLRQQEFWLPDPAPCAARRGCPRHVRLYQWLHISLGWALSTLMVVGLTGLMRKD